MKKLAQIIKNIALCPYQSSLAARSKTLEVIDIFTNLPTFHLTLDILELLINTDFFPVVYKLASSRSSLIRGLLQSEYKES